MAMVPPAMLGRPIVVHIVRSPVRSTATACASSSDPLPDVSRGADDERRPALEVRAAGLARAEQLDVDHPLTALVTLFDHRTAVGELVAGPRLLAELHTEAAQVLGAEPIGCVRRQHAGLQHADGE